MNQSACPRHNFNQLTRHTHHTHTRATRDTHGGPDQRPDVSLGSGHANAMQLRPRPARLVLSSLITAASWCSALHRQWRGGAARPDWRAWTPPLRDRRSTISNGNGHLTLCPRVCRLPSSRERASLATVAALLHFSCVRLCSVSVWSVCTHARAPTRQSGMARWHHSGT